MSREVLPTLASGLVSCALLGASTLSQSCKGAQAEPSREASSSAPDSSSAEPSPSRAGGGEPASGAGIGPPPEPPGPAEPPDLPDPPEARTLTEQREALLLAMRRELSLTPAQLAEVRAIFEGSRLLGQGRPDDTVHPMNRKSCRARRRAAKVVPGDPRCGAPHMVPVRAEGEADEAPPALCIDQFEFPNIPCEYPVTYPTAREAALLCRAVGKRLCDAHEWEGACAGALEPEERAYDFGKPRALQSHLHNQRREVRFAYGREKDHRKCAMGGEKSKSCDATGHVRCGSNTFPAGAFPECVSPFGVYDQHGNAAEHMSLPLTREERTRHGGTGHTEMKGSWFVFAHFRDDPHPSDCRWRASDWHPSKVMDEASHRNYHLGFRCCADPSPPE